MDLDGAAAAALRETPITRCQFGAVSLFRRGNRWRLSYCVAVSINLNEQQRFDPKLRSRLFGTRRRWEGRLGARGSRRWWRISLRGIGGLVGQYRLSRHIHTHYEASGSGYRRSDGKPAQGSPPRCRKIGAFYSKRAAEIRKKRAG